MNLPAHLVREIEMGRLINAPATPKAPPSKTVPPGSISNNGDIWTILSLCWTTRMISRLENSATISTTLDIV
jgi:hypothetical protein